MAGRISLMLSRTGGPPSHGSVGYVNDAVAPILTRNGWDVSAFSQPTRGLGEEALLPFGHASALVALEGASIPDIALFDGAGTVACLPSRRTAHRNIVLYHGLAYGAGAWLASPHVDLHGANSPYLARVLRALFAFPNWERRACLNPAAIGRVADLPLPVPCADHPDGAPGLAHGSDLSIDVLRALDGPTVWGHALQPGKQDWVATTAIMYWLDSMRTEGGAPLRLFVSEFSLNEDTRRSIDALLEPVGRRCSDYFVRLPHLNQSALFKLMRRCRFGLAYNRLPESFGFYVLESIHCGTPVYTNGVGNNRFLLPPEHGVHVFETPDMVEDADGQRDVAAYRAVAERIVSGLSRPQEVDGQCARGRALIRRQWSMQRFEAGLLHALQPPAQAETIPRFESLSVGLSPLVRSLDWDTGRMHNDYASRTLSPEELACASAVVGSTCADLASADMIDQERRFALFARGVLALEPAVPG